MAGAETAAEPAAGTDAEVGSEAAAAAEAESEDGAEPAAEGAGASDPDSAKQEQELREAERNAEIMRGIIRWNELHSSTYPVVKSEEKKKEEDRTWRTPGLFDHPANAPITLVIFILPLVLALLSSVFLTGGPAPIDEGVSAFFMFFMAEAGAALLGFVSYDNALQLQLFLALAALAFFVLALRKQIGYWRSGGKAGSVREGEGAAAASAGEGQGGEGSPASPGGQEKPDDSAGAPSEPDENPPRPPDTAPEAERVGYFESAVLRTCSLSEYEDGLADQVECYRILRERTARYAKRYRSSTRFQFLSRKSDVEEAAKAASYLERVLALLDRHEFRAIRYFDDDMLETWRSLCKMDDLGLFAVMHFLDEYAWAVGKEPRDILASYPLERPGEHADPPSGISGPA